MSKLVIEDRVIAVMGSDIDTDVIFPTRFVAEFDEHECGKHVFADADPDFVNKASGGGIILAGDNFGCGSAREQAASGLKGAGVTLIIAPSFARSFYRNGINKGLPLLEIKNLRPGFAQEGDMLKAEIDRGSVINQRTGVEITFALPHQFILGIIGAGGIGNLYKQSAGYQNLKGIVG